MKKRTPVVVFLAFFLLLALGMGVFYLARPHGLGYRLNVCRNNMRSINNAKQQLANLKGLTNGSIILSSDLVQYLTRTELPRCPDQGNYTINPFGQSPSCSIHESYPPLIERQMDSGVTYEK